MFIRTPPPTLGNIFLYKREKTEKRKEKIYFICIWHPKVVSSTLPRGKLQFHQPPHFLQLYYFSTETVKTIPLSFTLYVIDLRHVGLGMEIINSALLFQRYHSFQTDRPLTILGHFLRALSRNFHLWFCGVATASSWELFTWGTFPGKKETHCPHFFLPPPFINLKCFP